MNGGKLGKAFVSLGFVKDEEITSLLSRQYGVPSINLEHFEVDPAIIRSSRPRRPGSTSPAALPVRRHPHHRHGRPHERVRHGTTSSS